MSIKTDLATFILEMIKANEWTIQDAARELCIFAGRIRQISRGDFTHISTDYLIDVAEKLGAEVSVNIEARS